MLNMMQSTLQGKRLKISLYDNFKQNIEQANVDINRPQEAQELHRVVKQYDNIIHTPTSEYNELIQINTNKVNSQLIDIYENTLE